MDAVVLVGGEGTRLRPLTYDIPKQMLPVALRPMIEHVVGWLGHHGVSRAVLSLGYRADRFTEAYPSGSLAGIVLDYAVEPEPLDTAGAILFAARHAGIDAPFVVVNADVLTDFDLGSLVSFHQARGAAASIHLTPVADPSAFGVVPTDESGRVEAFIEKPASGTAPTNLINAGTYVLDLAVLDLIPEGRRVSIERETFPLLAERRSLYALASDAYWLDTGTPETFLRASLDIISGMRQPEWDFDGDGARAGDPESSSGSAREIELDKSTLVGRDVIIGAGAKVSCSAISDSVEIGSGATVDRSVVMQGAQIGKGARVESSIIGAGARIGERSVIGGNTVVGCGAHLAPGTVLLSARYPS